MRVRVPTCIYRNKFNCSNYSLRKTFVVRKYSSKLFSSFSRKRKFFNIEKKANYGIITITITLQACMFVNISPLESNMAETISSMEFGQNARQVELGKATKHVTKGS